MEDNINFVSMKNKGNHHGRKADILWTFSVREGGVEGSGGRTHNITFGVHMPTRPPVPWPLFFPNQICNTSTHHAAMLTLKYIYFSAAEVHMQPDQEQTKGRFITLDKSTLSVQDPWCTVQ